MHFRTKPVSEKKNHLKPAINPPSLVVVVEQQELVVHLLHVVCRPSLEFDLVVVAIHLFVFVGNVVLLRIGVLEAKMLVLSKLEVY